MRLPRELPAWRSASGPPVSIIVPARNEARNIVRVLESLAGQRYTDFEILVVDDRSDDGTADLARAVAPGNAARIEVIEGAELPADWFGKPWACHQGAERATGELLLFTDADTIHGPALLARAIAALDEDEAGVVTVVGRQVMGSFWERLVQPHIFAAMVVRFSDVRRPVPPDRWRSAVANGQFLLFRRGVLEAVGGFASVRGEVVEDLRLAQRLVRLGHGVSLRRAEDAFATRMYHSLREIVDGWSKNLVLGGMATLPPGWLRTLTPLLSIASGLAIWIAPPATLVVALLGFGGPAVLVWAAATTSVSAIFWIGVTHRMRAPAPYGLLYPLGAAMALWIVLRAWRRGTEVEWKGRRYVVAHHSEDDARPGDP